LIVGGAVILTRFFLGSGKRNREYGRGNNNNNAGRIIITMAKSGSG
jgi:hypothetical protein